MENYWSKHSEIKEDEKKVAPFAVYKEEADRWTDPDTGQKYDDIFTPVWRWRRAFYNDFVCRMDWCTKSYDPANHNPVAAFGSNSADSIIRLKAKPGDVLSLGASASTDPDGDSLNFKWFAYPEAGTYSRTVNIATSSSAKASMTVPQDAQVRQIHIILQVWDNSKIVSMYDYRRVVIDVGD